MPVNKNAGLRYKLIDECLRSRNRNFTMEEIVEAVSDYFLKELGKKSGVSKSSIEKDLRHMASNLGAPIEKEKSGKYWYWYYTDKNFSLSNSPLDRKDAEKLKEALIILGEFTDFPQFNDLEEIIIKLESKLALSKKQDHPFIQFDKNADADGNRHLRGLYNKLMKKLVLDISYQPFGEKMFNIRLHPYLLKEYNNRWFLFGKNHKDRKIWNLALDRILSYEDSNLEFEDDARFKPEEYFKDVIGVSVKQGGSPEKIILSFSPEQGNYVRTKPIHFSQKIIIDNKKEFRIELWLIPNYELKRLIQSFGEHVKVVIPINLLSSISAK